MKKNKLISFASYLFDHLFFLCCYGAAAMLIGGLLWLIQVRGIFILFAELILAAAVFAPLLLDFLRRRDFYTALYHLLETLDQKTLLGEISMTPSFLDGQILLDLLRGINKYQNDRLASMEGEILDYREYVESWVHEIKTPIASARLIAENAKNPATLRMEEELQRIDRYVEQALYYARSASAEKDFRVEPTSLKFLVTEAIKTYSKPLIRTRCQIHMENLDLPLHADVKSCAFLIGQILSNSIKYRKDDFHLTFQGQRTANSVRLSITDNGIGISKRDLPRIFDKGFTGEHGRTFPKSTGIGLYLCKKLCDNMNIQITAESAPNAGTTILLTFPEESFVFSSCL